MSHGHDQPQIVLSWLPHRGVHIEPNSFTRFSLKSFIADVPRTGLASNVFQLTLSSRMPHRTKQLQRRFWFRSFIADVARKRPASDVFQLTPPWQVSHRTNCFTSFSLNSFIADVTRTRPAPDAFHLTSPSWISHRTKQLQRFLAQLTHR